MTLNELKDFVKANYPGFFNIGADWDNRIFVEFNKSLFPNTVYITESSVLAAFKNENIITVCDLINLEGLDKDCLPFIETYKSRYLDLDVTDEFVLKIILDRLVNRLKALQVQIKELMINRKLNNINEDF
jgi:hypothetical protein